MVKKSPSLCDAPEWDLFVPHAEPLGNNTIFDDLDIL